MMSPEFITLSLFFVCLLLLHIQQLYMGKKERETLTRLADIERQRLIQQHDDERQKLLDRIQAKDFVEYKAMSVQPKPKERDPEDTRKEQLVQL